MCGGKAALHARASDKKTRPDTRYQAESFSLTRHARWHLFRQ